jgi:serine/threonine protein kinase
VGECDSVTTQFAHAPALRNAIQQRDELQAQLQAAEDSGDFVVVGTLGEQLEALKRKVNEQPLSEEGYLTLADRHEALVQKVMVTCKDLTKAKDWAALQPIAAKLQELKALATSLGSSTENLICPSSPAPGVENISDAANTSADAGTSLVYASNGVPITNVQELRSTQPGLRAASVRLMLRGEFKTPDGAGVIHTYRCLIKCAASHAADIDPSVTNVDRLRIEHAMYQEVQRLASAVGTGCMRCYSLDPAGLYMVLEDHGTDLRALLNADLKSPQMVMEGVVPAVHALHSMNIMHGDIKPENLLVQHTLQGHYIVKLCDLECAKKVGEVCEAAALGTKHYLAREVRIAAASATGTLRASTAVDMFALGLVLWQVMKRSPTAALDCDDEARLELLYSDQAQLNAHLEYPARHRTVAERMTCLDPARRINITELWRHVTAQDISLMHQQNVYLKSSVHDKLDSMDAKLDKVLEQLKVRFDALGGSVVGIAESLRQQVLLGGEHAQVLKTIQQATEDTLQRLSAGPDSPAPEAQAQVIQSSMADMRARIEDSLATALAAQATQTREEALHAQSTLKALSEQFSGRFDELTTELESHMQEQRRSNADASQQRAALERTTASLTSVSGRYRTA